MTEHRVKGVGVDIVDLGTFAVSLDEPGTRFTRVFSATERRQATERAHSRGATGTQGTVAHLAARWAVKEAVIKAWSAALYGTPPVIAQDTVTWTEIETVCDAWGRPAVRLSGEIARQVARTLGEHTTWHVSLSHDGHVATAFVVVESSVG